MTRSTPRQSVRVREVVQGWRVPTVSGRDDSRCMSGVTSSIDTVDTNGELGLGARENGIGKKTFISLICYYRYLYPRMMTFGV